MVSKTDTNVKHYFIQVVKKATTCRPLLSSWLKWSLRHIQDAEPRAKGIFDDCTLPNGNIERFDKDAAPLRLKGLHGRDSILHEIVDFNARWNIRVAMNNDLCIGFWKGKPRRSFIPPHWS